MKTIQRRAAVGGEVGANGEWYDGGKFINTVAENAKSREPARKATGKQEIEPYKWGISPEGKMSLYRQLSGVEIFDRASMQFIFNQRLGLYFATPEAVASRKTKIAAFNSGERWV